MPKTRFTAILSTFILCMGIWIFVTWSFSVQELAAGAVVSLAASVFVAQFFNHEGSFRFYGPLDILKLLVYSFTFLVELVKANVDMAKRVYGGCKKVNPGIVKVPTDMKSDYGLALVANSITLTPGTITLDVAEENGQNCYYIHWIDVTAESGAAAGDIIKGNLEKSAKKVFN